MQVVTMPYSNKMALALAEDFKQLVINVDPKNADLILEVNRFIIEFKKFNGIFD